MLYGISYWESLVMETQYVHGREKGELVGKMEISSQLYIYLIFIYFSTLPQITIRLNWFFVAFFLHKKSYHEKQLIFIPILLLICIW